MLPLQSSEHLNADYSFLKPHHNIVQQIFAWHEHQEEYYSNS